MRFTAANFIMTSPLVNLLNFDRKAMEAWFIELREPKYRAQQILQWIHQYGVSNLQDMTNISKTLRQKLADCAEIKAPEVALDQLAQDGTRKWLLRLNDGNCVETVFIPEENRGTLCVSSQVGCALNCSFCSTGHQGYNRDLTVAEIIGQVWLAVRKLSTDSGKHDHHVTNVVMMGMGEPLLNFDHVVAAMNIMMDDFAYGLSKRRVTLSTSGIVPAMERLAEVSDVALAVSLHAPNNPLRDVLVPINKKYPLEQLLATCKNYFKKDSRRRITMEYVMLDGVNDTPAHAHELANILQGVPCKINLIPFNPFPGTHYQRSPTTTINRFRDILLAKGFNTITRRTRGDDIDAACGQLVGQVADRTTRSRRLQTIPVVKEISNL